MSNNVINFTVTMNGNAVPVAIELNDSIRLIRVEFSHLFHLNAEKFSYLKGQDEIGRDHPDAIFKCFQGEIDGYTVRIKLKCNQDGNILWALELK